MSEVLVEWRARLSSGAALDNTTLRKHFPEWVFKHDQRQPPKASSLWGFFNRLRLWCCGWQRANKASQIRGKRESKASKIKEQLLAPQIKERLETKSTAYCALYHFLV